MDDFPRVELKVYDTEDPILNHSSRVIPEWIQGRSQFDIEVTPEVVTFNTQVVPLLSETVTVKLTNTGFDNLPLVGITVDSPFTIVSDFPSYLRPGETYELLLRFKPLVYGLSQGFLHINMGEIAGSRDVLVLGQGIWDYRLAVAQMTDGLWEFIKRSVRPANRTNGPVLSLSTTSIAFPGTTEVGKESNVIMLTISNVGTQNLVITDPVLDAGPFEIVP